METIVLFTRAIKAFVLRKPIVSTLIALAAVFGGYWYYSGGSGEEKINFSEVKRGTVSQVVSVTGRVKPSKDANLSFEKLIVY